MRTTTPRSHVAAGAAIAALVAIATSCSSASTGAVSSGGGTASSGASTSAPASTGDVPTSSRATPRTRQSAPDGTALAPTATSGVLTGGAVGAMACPEGRACPDMAVILTGHVQAAGLAGVGEATIESTGAWGMALPPGDYSVTVVSSNGTCEPADATVVAGTVTEVQLRCTGS